MLQLSILNDIDNGKVKMYHFDEFENEMNKFEEELILKYAN